MTLEIIILNTNSQPDGSFSVSGVFWLVPSNNFVPLPTFVSQVPFVDSTNLLLLRSGQLVEQSFITGLYASGTILSSVQTDLQSQFTTAQTNLTNSASPLVGAIGDNYNGTTWSTSNPFTPAYPTSQVITGTITSSGSTTPINITDGHSSISWQFSGTWGGIINFEKSIDGTNWVPMYYYGYDTTDGNSLALLNGVYYSSIGSVQWVRLRTVGTSGTINWTVSISTGIKSVSLTEPLPSGGNAIGSVTAGQGSPNSLANAWPIKITDMTNGPVAIKAASTAAIATDSALVVAVSPNNTVTTNVPTIVDKASMTAGSQPGVPMIGQSYGVGRLARLTRLGFVNKGDQTLLAMDSIEGTTINTWLWTQSTTTMTIAQTTGVLTLNSGAITTTTTDAILTTNRQFQIFDESPLVCSFKACVTQTTNAVQELGFGAPSGTTATINNGAFFRINSSGNILGVTSFNGTETVSATLATISNSTSYFVFMIAMEDGGARFIVEDSSGIPIVDSFIALPVTTAEKAAVSHLPAFARVRTTGAAGVAPTIKISSFQVWLEGISTNKLWSEQMAGSGRQANVNPATFAQTIQLAAGAAPSTVTPTNATSQYSTLGGEYIINATASSENLLGVFGYQVPSPYTLYITDISMPQPFVTTVLGSAVTTIQEWCLMIASTNVPSSAAGFRSVLGAFTNTVSSAPVGTIFNGTPISQKFTTPLVVLPGQYVLVLVKAISGSATGTTRGSIAINGYYE